MKYDGELYNWLEEDGAIKEAIVTPQKVAIDWEENGTMWHLIAKPDNAGVYRGHYGEGRLEPSREVELNLYKARSGEIILIGAWRDRERGEGSINVFRLRPQRDLEKPATRNTKRSQHAKKKR